MRFFCKNKAELLAPLYYSHSQGFPVLLYNCFQFIKTYNLIMAEYFSDVKAKGPEMVIEEEGTKDLEYREFLRQDAYQRVNDLLRRLNLSSN
jgi:hypothetical protein